MWKVRLQRMPIRVRDARDSRLSRTSTWTKVSGRVMSSSNSHNYGGRRSSWFRLLNLLLILYLFRPAAGLTVASRYHRFRSSLNSHVESSSSGIYQRTKEWEVFVDQTKASLDKGASATLDALHGLAPPSVVVKPALIPKTKLKGPVVRCISNLDDRLSFDVGSVDSVDKVYRTLTKHMKLQVSFVRLARVGSTIAYR